MAKFYGYAIFQTRVIWQRVPLKIIMFSMDQYVFASWQMFLPELTFRTRSVIQPVSASVTRKDCIFPNVYRVVLIFEQN